MKKKNNLIRRLTITVVSFLISISAVSVGFASWMIAGGDSERISGSMSTYDVVDNEVPVPLVSVTQSPSFSALAGRGFLNSSNEYVNNTTLTWRLSLNGTRAKDVIESMSTNSMSLNVALSISNTPSLISSFSVSTMTLTPLTSTGGTATVYTDSHSETSSIEQKWNMTGVSNSTTSILYTLQIPLTYTGSLSSFPNLNTNKISLTILPGEYQNA